LTLIDLFCRGEHFALMITRASTKLSQLSFRIIVFGKARDRLDRNDRDCAQRGRWFADCTWANGWWVNGTYELLKIADVGSCKFRTRRELHPRPKDDISTVRPNSLLHFAADFIGIVNNCEFPVTFQIIVRIQLSRDISAKSLPNFSEQLRKSQFLNLNLKIEKS